VKPLAIAFDLDGTLVDSRRDIAAAANHVRESAGLERLSEDTVASFVGDGAKRLVAGVLGMDLDDARLAEHLEAFVAYYTAHPVAHTTLMPGAIESLEALSAYPLALCTNKVRRTTDAVLEALGLARYFRVIVAGGDVAHSKPHPLPLEHIARALDVPTQALVMVGDGPQDVECGHAVGAHTVGLEGGILPIERLLASKPHTMLRSLHELPALVETLRAY
jgi:phosphoglycolate phosphatase